MSAHRICNEKFLVNVSGGVVSIYLQKKKKSISCCCSLLHTHTADPYPHCSLLLFRQRSFDNFRPNTFRKCVKLFLVHRWRCMTIQQTTGHIIFQHISNRSRLIRLTICRHKTTIICNETNEQSQRSQSISSPVSLSISHLQP